MDLSKFKEKFEKKNADPGKIEGKAYKEHSVIMPIHLDGISQKLYVFDGSAPYFLRDLEKVKLEILREVEEGEEWKETESRSWQETIDQAIEKNSGKAIEIEVPYSTVEKLKEDGVLEEDPYYKFFYLPESFDSDIKKFNEYSTTQAKKSAEKNFAELVDDINFN